MKAKVAANTVTFPLFVKFTAHHSACCTGITFNEFDRGRYSTYLLNADPSTGRVWHTDNI